MQYSISIVFFIFPLVTSCHDSNFNIQGKIAPGWESIRNLFEENFVNKRDLGASLAVYHQGEPVVDLYGGWFDQLQTKPYDDQTLQYVFSMSKGVVAIAVGLCVQRGLLDYSALVTRYWPEYGQYGKENTTVADILSHRAGLPIDNSPLKQHLNWTAMIHTFEQREPQWSPGTAQGYHSLTFGWLAGELVRRVDPKKRTFGQFVRDEIANPLEIELYIGLPPELEYRVSPIESTLNHLENIDKDEISPLAPFNDRRIHQAELPAANGITNARSLAKLYSSLIGDLKDSKYKRLLNEETLQQAIKVNTREKEVDLTFGVPTKFGMGFLLYDDMITSLGSNVFGHSGFGGSISFAAPGRNLSFAYVINRLHIDDRINIDARCAPIINQIGINLSVHLDL